MKLFNWIKYFFKRNKKTSTVLIITPADHLREYEPVYTMTLPTYGEVEYGHGSVDYISVVEIKKAK
jgi:hypothetical protein